MKADKTKEMKNKIGILIKQFDKIISYTSMKINQKKTSQRYKLFK